MAIVVTDGGETFYVHRRDGVMLIYEGAAREPTELTLSSTRARLVAMLLGATTPTADEMEGDAGALSRLLAHRVTFSQAFDIIEP